MSQGITAITATGSRPEAFALAERYWSSQTYSGPLQWVVVDDGPRATACTQGQSVVRPTPCWVPGQNTLVRNLLAALPLVEHPWVVFWEDDDYYAPWWLEACAARLVEAELVAERFTKYYHVPSRQFRVMRNDQHGSLCQTALRANLLPLLQTICQNGTCCVDAELWRSARKQGAAVHLDQPTLGCVGMKGLPGRTGIGVGHHPEKQNYKWERDAQLSVLQWWLGSAAENYVRWMHGPE